MEIGTKMNGIDEAEIKTQPNYSESTSIIDNRYAQLIVKSYKGNSIGSLPDVRVNG